MKAAIPRMRRRIVTTPVPPTVLSLEAKRA